MYDIYVGKRVSLLFRWGSLWIGGHWSQQNRQWCINLIPCLTIRVKVPRKQVKLHRKPKYSAIDTGNPKPEKRSLTPHICSRCRINYTLMDGLCRSCLMEEL